MQLINDLKKYREFLKSNVKKEIRGKYKGSFLGIVWSFLNPLLSVVVYAIIFPHIMGARMENYLIYLITGVVPWTFFTTSVNAGLLSIISNANIIKKVYFPRIILPISSVTSALINFLISLVIVSIFVLFSGIGFSWHLLFLPLVIAIQFILQLGIVFVLSAIDLYARDIESIVSFIMNMMFYAIPILYTPEIFPDRLKWVIYVNPLAHIINAYRDIFYYQTMPNFLSLGVVAIVSALIFWFGYVVFEKLQKGFAEEL